MKLIILLLCLFCFSPCVAYAQSYKHKPEAEIARMTPTQRVDEWLTERVRHLSDPHKWDPSDTQEEMIRRHLYVDGLKAVPRLVETIEGFDPKKSTKWDLIQRFDSAVDLLRYLDSFSVRLRSGDEGARATKALEGVIQRMRAAGFLSSDQALGREAWTFERHGILDAAERQLKDIRGINGTDRDVQDTLRFVYKIEISDTEMLDLSNFLVSYYPTYPSWSGRELTKDHSRLNSAGNPVQIFVLKESERFHQAYTNFKSGQDCRKVVGGGDRNRTDE